MISRIGLSIRLNIIVITIILVILAFVAYFANTGAANALRNQAVTRFSTNSSDAFQTVDRGLLNFEDFGTRVANWVGNANNLNITADINRQILSLVQEDPNAVLLYAVSIVRPNDSAIWISPANPERGIEETRLRILASSQVQSSPEISEILASDESRWFLQDASVLDTASQPTITLSVPYMHSTGNGVVLLEMLQADFRRFVVDTLNRNGLLLETIAGYVMILDDDGDLIDIENVDDRIETVTANTVIYNQRLRRAERTREGLYLFNDPHNNDKAGLFNIQTFTANDWDFVALLPVAEIPVLPSAVYQPILLIGAIGIVVLIFAVNRFIALAVVRPLVDLGKSAEEIGSGHLELDVAHREKYDEIGRLAKSMDIMRSQLQDSYTELEQWSNTLEDRVEDRTEQLREARQQAEQTAQQLQVVYDESLSVVNEAQLGPVLDTFIDRILLLLDATYCAIWLLDDDRLRVRLVASNDVRRRIGTGTVQMQADQGIVGQAIRLDQPIIVNDYENYEHRVRLDKHFHDPRPPFFRGVCAPLRFAGSAIGAVVVGRNEDSPPFNLEAQRQLTLFTNMVSPSVRNAQLFTQLQAALKEAERANEVKTRFLASVTHELRTPLNLIINNMDFMRVGAFGNVNDEQISRLNQTVRSAEHLLYLINDLLDVSKIEAGEMQLFIQPSEVYTMLEDAVDNAHALLDTYSEKNDKVDLNVDIEEGLPEVPMDTRRIRQVLNNLLSNAIKFTQNGTITLKVFKDYAGIHFSVHDTGMGIPPAEMKKLFAAFERTTAAKQYNIEGTGLGLPISRYMVQQHGSDMTVISQEGEGSTFAFTLPFTAVDSSSKNAVDTQQITAILSSETD